MSACLHKLCCLANDEGGATAIEYGLLAAVLGGAIIAIAATLEGMITNGFGNLGNGFESGTEFEADFTGNG